MKNNSSDRVLSFLLRGDIGGKVPEESPVNPRNKKEGNRE
jgi:hypothetical protein